MISEEEHDAISKTLMDLIQETVPSAVESTNEDGTIAYRIQKGETLELFCLLLIRQDQLEVRFPDCPDVAMSDSHFEAVGGTRACRLAVRKRSDIPGDALRRAIRAAAGSE